MIVGSVFGAFEAYGAENVLGFFPKAGHHFDMIGDGQGDPGAVNVRSSDIVWRRFGHGNHYRSLSCLGSRRNRGKSLCFGWDMMLMFLNIYKTSSRDRGWTSSWLPLLVIFAGGKLRKYILVIGPLSIAAMVVRPGIWATVKGIYDNSFDMNTSTGTSYEYRYALQHAVTAKLESPTRAVWGFGLESFYDLHLEDDFLGKPHVFLSCDSSWSELMIETGFVGLAIIILILV